MALTKATNRMTSGASINVLDFGATGDGTTDDTSAFTAALTAATGKSLFIPSGSYSVSSTMTIPSNTRVFGEGLTSEIKRDTTATPFDIFSLLDKEHITIENILINGVTKLDNAVASNRYSAIRIHSSSTTPNDILIQGVHINTTTNGENQAEGNRGCITIEDANDIRIDKCKFYDNRGTAILLSSTTTEVQIEQCWGKGEEAPYLAAYPDGFGSFISGDHDGDVLVSGCYVDNFGFSNISLNGVRSTVQNCISKNSTFTGINIGHTTAGSACDDSIVKGNICIDNSFEGIAVAGSKNIVIDGNLCRSNDTTVDRPEIRILHDSSYTAGDVKKIIISNNHLLESKSTGIIVECGTDIFITGNQIADAQSGGIYTKPSESSETMNIYITDNHIHDCGGDTSAIEIKGASADGDGTVNAYCLNNMIDSSDATTIMQMGITSNGDNANIQIDGNWFASTYTATGVNTVFADRNAKSLNAFSSGTLINANIINV
jgi:parallel beta-helix repeat protein